MPAAACQSNVSTRDWHLVHLAAGSAIMCCGAAFTLYSHAGNAQRAAKSILALLGADESRCRSGKDKGSSHVLCIAVSVLICQASNAQSSFPEQALPNTSALACAAAEIGSHIGDWDNADIIYFLESA